MNTVNNRVRGLAGHSTVFDPSHGGLNLMPVPATCSWSRANWKGWRGEAGPSSGLPRGSDCGQREHREKG